MHHIPLYDDELATVNTATAGSDECSDVAAIISASRPRPDGLTVLSLTEDQRSAVAFRLSLLNSLCHQNSENLDTAREAVGHRLMGETNAIAFGSDETRTARAHPEFLAAESEAENARLLWGGVQSVTTMFGPLRPDRDRVEKSLLEAGVSTRHNFKTTDAASQLFDADGGCWSSRDLYGKAAQYAGRYVRLRRNLAVVATRLGMGRLVEREHRRLVWDWAPDWLVPPANRRSLPAD